MMKKKLLTTAIATALVGGVGTANAVNVNSDGLGQVLLYPYYTVREGNDTLISIVNTTNEVKALKVRVLEGKNSREVLDFNLYLSPLDVWTAALSATADGGQLTTEDASCTVPDIPAGGVEFRNFEFSGVRSDGETVNLDRTREGYIEVIEMGTVTDEPAPSSFTPATWATHTGTPAVPSNCPALVAAWSGGGAWVQSNNRAILPATGNLFGGGILVNVERGTASSYNATALDGFRVFDPTNPGDSGPVHTAPGSLLPSLEFAFPATSFVFNGVNVTETNWALGIDAVSATLMHNSLINEFLVDPGLAADTDWVVTFPTKKFYVQRGDFLALLGRARRPFNELFGGGGENPVPGGACETVDIAVTDREEQFVVGGVDFSPTPPAGRNALCWETNVISFNDLDVSDGSSVLGSTLNSNVPTDFTSGWARLSFSDTTQFMANPENLNADNDRFNGLPAIGFSVYQFVNGDVGGLLSNYDNLFDHRATRSIVEGAL